MGNITFWGAPFSRNHKWLKTLWIIPINRVSEELNFKWNIIPWLLFSSSSHVNGYQYYLIQTFSFKVHYETHKLIILNCFEATCFVAINSFCTWSFMLNRMTKSIHTPQNGFFIWLHQNSIIIHIVEVLVATTWNQEKRCQKFNANT